MDPLDATVSTSECLNDRLGPGLPGCLRAPASAFVVFGCVRMARPAREIVAYDRQCTSPAVAASFRCDGPPVRPAIGLRVC
jgi:hypothetical protein